MTHEASLLLLSGLGADERLFQVQKARFPGLVVPRWIEPFGNESLGEYASRLADQLSALRPHYIGGASFGGMLALEMARLLRPRAVFLLGSCRSPVSISYGLRLGGGLARRLPLMAFRLALSRSSFLAWAMGPCGRDVREVLVDMHQCISPSFLRWGLRSILAWDGIEDPGVPVHHIHGSADRILPLRRVQPDRVLPRAGHLLTLTHGDAVNEYLAEKMTHAG